jgi:hypothetical protein
MPSFGHSLRPAPGASRQMHRKSRERRAMTSRQMNDHKPVCTNSSEGPVPTSVYAIAQPSIVMLRVSNGQTD